MSLKNKPITVSVIIATYNRAGYLPESLDSILAQSRPADEIILVDDGSNDDTPDVAAGYAGQIRYFRQDNRGKPAALNFAIPKAIGSHVCFFDDDDVMLAHALETHVSFLASHPDIDYSYSKNFTFDENDETTIWDPTRWRTSWLAKCPPEELFVRTMEWNGASLRGMLVNIDCVKAVGLFQEHLLRAQDYDLTLRLARRFRGANIDNATFVHRNHVGSRGPAHARFTAAARYRASHQYEHIIFRDLRNTLALEEYLPKNPDFSPIGELTDNQRADALLARCQIMFSRGLYAEGAEDVALLLSESKLSPSQYRGLVALVTRASNIQQPDFLPEAELLARQLAKATRQAAGKPVLDAAIKGFYWALIRECQKKRWAYAFALTRALAIVGVQKIKTRSA